MRSFLLLLLLTTCCTIGYSQTKNTRRYTDHKPQYRKWLDSYILDKIEYKPDATIFYFRFVCDNANSGGAVFYPPGGTYAWYLKGKNKNYEITAVRNVRRNGKMVKRSVEGLTFSSEPVGKTGKTIFSCEVHFGPLDNDMKQADLIEGRGQEFNRRHFNCFSIKLKTWDDETLGSEEDSKKTIEAFEKQYATDEVGEDVVVDEEPVVEVAQSPRDLFSDTPEKTEPTPYSGASKPLRRASDLSCGTTVILDRIQFQDNSTDFKGIIDARKTLWILFCYLRDTPGSTVTIYGHSDIFGDQERNEELSRQRAYKIQRWLSMYGIHPKRIECKWFGGTRPLVAEGSPSNRRVEAQVQCP